MRRFLSAFYPPAIWNKVERFTQVETENFRVRSRTLQVPGWREVYGSDENGEERLPPLVSGQDQASDVPVKPLDYTLDEEVTRPPGRITEGRLLGMMERAGKDLEDENLSEAMKDKGLGTPATRADIIENLISKEYILRLREGLKPTSKGIRLIDFLHRIDSAGLASAELTGEWEKHLREVEHEKMARTAFMKGISEFTAEVVEKIKLFEYDNLYKQDPPIGVCPHNPSVPVVEFFWGYRCQNGDANGDKCPHEGCPAQSRFVIWKEISGRYIDRKTAGRLLSQRRTPLLPGFVDRQGREYQASLFLDETQQVKVQGEESADTVVEEVMGDPLGPCPHGKDCQILETTTRYVCRTLFEEGAPQKGDDSCCGFVLPKLVCKREITVDEAQVYLKEGRTPPLEGFISKFNRPFTAILYRKENNRHGFEFIKRPTKEGEEDKGATAKSRGRGRGKTAKKATTKKATAKKTVTKKASTKTAGKTAVRSKRTVAKKTT
jgi:DNA topoisomerase-3